MEERSRNLMEKMMRCHIPASELLRKDVHLYSAFDSDGVPTHDAAGNELSKSTMKKLRKNWEKQAVLYANMAENPSRL